jgi:hypothetical protein
MFLIKQATAAVQPQQRPNNFGQGGQGYPPPSGDISSAQLPLQKKRVAGFRDPTGKIKLE